MLAQNKIKSQQIIDNEKFQGIINRIETFPSKYITPRTVDIWLPKDYSSNKKYRVPIHWCNLSLC